ncbi:MAG: response regulator [Bacteroidota bacterium]
MVSDDSPVALLVEDNEDIRHYIELCLQGNYRVIQAVDGQDGIEKALEHIPDIIISDVMMPEKDGFELCEVLKEDIKTSHIPIILLTAKSDVASRIYGLKHGADDYLAKPFHEEELLVRMQNLLEVRRKLQERYQNLYDLPAPKAQEKSPEKEDDFILQFKSLVEARIDDPDFEINELSESFHMTRTHLGRKIKALTGRSLNIYIRSLRLQKARHLLLTTDRSIKEIGYDVGLYSPPYFSRTYQEEFGESPKMTRENRN